MNRTPTRKQNVEAGYSDENLFRHKDFPFLRQGALICDRYEVFEVNEGGFAYVLGVEDAETGERLAVKVPKRKWPVETSQSKEEFAQEIAFWVNLEPHPNIVTAQFVQDIQGEPALFMEYVSNTYPRSMRELLNIGALSNEVATNFGYQICTAMEFANRKQEIVHLDLKPENLLLLNETTLKVTDFGLSHRVAVVDKVYTRRSAGSWPYSPPELFKQEPCDTRSDMFSLGVILYEMLIGSLPYPFPLDDDPQKAYHQLQAFHAKDGMDSICTDMYYNGVNGQKGRIFDVVSTCLQPSRGERPRNFRVALDFFQELLGKTDSVTDVSLTQNERLARVAALQRVGEHSQALSILNQLLIEEPSNASYYFSAAKSFAALGQHGTASHFQEKAEYFQRENDSGTFV